MPLVDVTLEYKTIAKEQLVGKGWSSYFSIDPKCAITSCKLMAVGCTAPYAGKNLKIATTNPF